MKDYKFEDGVILGLGLGTLLGTLISVFIN